MTHTAPLSTRASVFEAAEQVLRSAGPAALSVRRIADLADTSTQAVYTQFGGKPGLADALYREGYRRLEQRIAALDLPGDPIDRIRALAWAYRENALVNAHLYDLMTARPLPEYDPPVESRREALRTIEPLIEAIRDAVESGALAGDPRRITQHLWAAGHGLISLTLNGLELDDDAEEIYREMLDTMIDQHRPEVRSSAKKQPERGTST